jgi:hypothetical protein
MLSFELKRIGEIPLLFGRAIRSYRFALAAFLIPLLVRSIPEILVGPYPIGWDTIAFYAPKHNRLSRGKTGFQSAPNDLEGVFGKPCQNRSQGFLSANL